MVLARRATVVWRGLCCWRAGLYCWKHGACYVWDRLGFLGTLSGGLEGAVVIGVDLSCGKALLQQSGCTVC